MTAPRCCLKTGDVFDGRDQYVKTFCLVSADTNRYQAKLNCEIESMKLANSSVFLVNLILFAGKIQLTGGFIWVDGKDGIACKSLHSNGSDNFTLVNSYCYSSHVYICEFNSAFQIIFESIKYFTSQILPF